MAAHRIGLFHTVGAPSLAKHPHSLFHPEWFFFAFLPEWYCSQIKENSEYTLCSMRSDLHCPSPIRSFTKDLHTLRLRSDRPAYSVLHVYWITTNRRVTCTFTLSCFPPVFCCSPSMFCHFLQRAFHWYSVPFFIVPSTWPKIFTFDNPVKMSDNNTVWVIKCDCSYLTIYVVVTVGCYGTV